MVGAGAILMRRWGSATDAPVVGSSPNIPEAKAQSIPTLKMPTAKGWSPGHTPSAASGLAVNAFATKLKHPRWIYVLPNDDVLVAESCEEAGKIKTAFDYAIYSTMKRASAVGVSANRISLYRDADGDGVAETHEIFLQDQRQPFGMAMIDNIFYVGNTDGIDAFTYTTGATQITDEGRRLVEFKPGGHWTRSLLVSEDERQLYAGVGSLTNIADKGFDEEAGRAAIYQLDIASGDSRVFADGLRNPVGMAWEPSTNVLWTAI